MKIIIKPFEEKDLEQVKALIMECFPTIGIPNIKYQEEEKHFTLVVQTENKIIGHVRIDEIYDNIRDRSHYLLDYMCIKKEYQNHGIGSKLLEHVTKIAKEKKISYLELTSRKERHNAHQFYLKNDFQIRETYVFRKEI